jgi:hypothetical protein
MATQEQVRNFLAYWFQLGKPIVLAGNQGECLPAPVFYRGGYSQSFEDCWQQIMATEGNDCYLQGTTQSIAMMLSSGWEVTTCARCDMPVALPTLGIMTLPCPCDDLYFWPNNDVPVPRVAVDDDYHLSDIQRRLNRVQKPAQSSPRGPYNAEDTSAFSS